MKIISRVQFAEKVPWEKNLTKSVFLKLCRRWNGNAGTKKWLHSESQQVRGLQTFRPTTRQTYILQPNGYPTWSFHQDIFHISNDVFNTVLKNNSMATKKCISKKNNKWKRARKPLCLRRPIKISWQGLALYLLRSHRKHVRIGRCAVCGYERLRLSPVCRKFSAEIYGPDLCSLEASAPNAYLLRSSRKLDPQNFEIIQSTFRGLHSLVIRYEIPSSRNFITHHAKRNVFRAATSGSLLPSLRSHWTRSDETAHWSQLWGRSTLISKHWLSNSIEMPTILIKRTL